MTDDSGMKGSAERGGEARSKGLIERAMRAMGRLLAAVRKDRAHGGSSGRNAGTVSHDLREAFAHLRGFRHLGTIVVVAILGLYCLSGTYLVSSGELAVVTRFGRVVQARVAPGLRWHLPWPFEAARRVNVAQVRREGIGIAVAGHPAEIHPAENVQLMSGDENLLVAKVIVQYRVKEPVEYLFRVDYNEDPLLRVVLKAALTTIAGTRQVDALLTSGRTEVQQEARIRAQEILDAYGSGLEVVSVDLQEIAPPEDVAQAFRDVASAAEEKNRLINDAQGYSNTLIPQARGEAEKRLRDAEGYAVDVVNRAGGEARRFTDTLTQYQRDARAFGPQVTRYRLYVEMMEKILPRAKKYVVDPSSGGQVNLRFLDQMPAGQSPQR